MNITPNKLTIAQLLATPNEQFVVPSYQRRYAWGFNQFAALYEDIDILKTNDGHLFGTIILHSSHHTGGLNQPELVDGQQRMTTLNILLKAFEVVYKEKGKIDKGEEVKKMITCKGLDDVVKPKIVLGKLDNDDIRQLILHDKKDGFDNPRIEEAFSYYVKWLGELEVKELNEFYFKLTNIAVIIRLDVGAAQDAYKLFETINNRGLRLSSTDIIKNFLLGHAAKINDSNTLEKVKELWSSVIINLDRIDSDDFLRQFMCSVLFRKVTSTKLVQDFKKYYLNNVEKADLLGEYEYFVEDEEEDEEPDVEDGEEQVELSNDKFSIIDLLTKLDVLSEVYKKIYFALH